MKRLTTVLAAAALVASTSAYAALHGEAANEAARSSAVPSWMYGFWDDTSYKRLTMEILPPGHAFCTGLVKTRGACARTPLAGHVIGAALVLRGDRLAVPERYRSHNVGTCAQYVPIYRVSEDASPMRLTLIGYRDSGGRLVRVAAVRTADCEPPNRWQKRSALPSLSWELQAAQAATAAFRSVGAAREAGYVPASPCIASPSGAEGMHYVNPKLVDDPALNVTQPELLLYEPLRTGGLRLVGLEYFKVDADGKLETADDRPTLFGRPFQGPMPGHAPGQPVHYDLHVALWKSNPRGMFVGFNPTVSCRYDANRLYGKYQVRLGPNVDPQVPAGTWTLTMSPGKFSLIVSSEPTIDNHGVLRVVGERVVFSREVLCPAAVGRYRWNLDGRKLRLTLIGSDTCSGDDRVTVMTSKLWTKVS